MTTLNSLPSTVSAKPYLNVRKLPNPRDEDDRPVQSLPFVLRNRRNCCWLDALAYLFHTLWANHCLNLNTRGSQHYATMLNLAKQLSESATQSSVNALRDATHDMIAPGTAGEVQDPSEQLTVLMNKFRLSPDIDLHLAVAFKQVLTCMACNQETFTYETARYLSGPELSPPDGISHFEAAVRCVTKRLRCHNCNSCDTVSYRRDYGLRKALVVVGANAKFTAEVFLGQYPEIARVGAQDVKLQYLVLTIRGHSIGVARGQLPREWVVYDDLRDHSVVDSLEGAMDLVQRRYSGNEADQPNLNATPIVQVLAYKVSNDENE